MLAADDAFLFKTFARHLLQRLAWYVCNRLHYNIAANSSSVFHDFAGIILFHDVRSSVTRQEAGLQSFMDAYCFGSLVLYLISLKCM